MRCDYINFTFHGAGVKLNQLLSIIIFTGSAETFKWQHEENPDSNYAVILALMSAVIPKR